MRASAFNPRMDQQGSPFNGEYDRMLAKQTPTRLTERGLRRLLQKSMKNTRDLTAAVIDMWDKLQPRLLPGTIPAIDHPSINATPVRFVRTMTTALLHTLDMYERGGNVKTPRTRGGGRDEGSLSAQ